MKSSSSLVFEGNCGRLSLPGGTNPEVMSETDDHVEARLNPNVRGLPPSATVAINDRSNELRRQGREIFKLGLGQSPFPVPDQVVEALRQHAPEKDYLPVQVVPPGRGL